MFFPGWRTEYILVEQGEVVSPRLIPLLPLWSKFSRAAGKASGGVSRKELPSSWVPGSCTGLVAAQDSYLHIQRAIKMPTNTFCLFAVFLMFSQVHREWLSIFVILAGVGLIQLKEHNLHLLMFAEIQHIHSADKTRLYLLGYEPCLECWLPRVSLCCSCTAACPCPGGIPALAPWGSRQLRHSLGTEARSPCVMLAGHPQLWVMASSGMGEAQAQLAQPVQDSGSPGRSSQVTFAVRCSARARIGKITGKPTALD